MLGLDHPLPQELDPGRLEEARREDNKGTRQAYDKWVEVEVGWG